MVEEEETKASTPPSGGQGVGKNIVKCHRKDKESLLLIRIEEEE